MTKIDKKEFGKLKNGDTVYAFTLRDEASGAFVRILSLGGIVQSLMVPDKEGIMRDVVLGYDTPQEYLENDGYLGALIGRFGNRIADGHLEIDGTVYALNCNNGANHLHGGNVGFDKKLWACKIVNEELHLSLLSPDGEENYPGSLEIKAIYAFSEGALSIQYFAVSDKKTAINLTNHAYFNLNGEGEEGTTLDHELQINSSLITPTDAGLIPRGGFKRVHGTPFDFTKPKKLKEGLKEKDQDIDLKQGNGFDHCFILNKNEDCSSLNKNCDSNSPFAILFSEKSGIEMRCFTDMPAVQFYGGNGLSARGKGDKQYGNYGAICLETQAIPNNVNVPEYAEYGSSIYEAGQEYRFFAKYAFGVRK